MPSSSKAGLKGCSLLALGSSLSAFTAQISSLKTSSCACLIKRIPAEITSSVCRQPSLLRAIGKRQFSMKRSTRAETLVSLLQLEYLFGCNRSSLHEERNALSTVCSFIWCNFRISTSNTLLVLILFSGHSEGSCLGRLDHSTICLLQQEQRH